MKKIGLRFLNGLFFIILIVTTSGFLYMEYLKSLDNPQLYEELRPFYKDREIASLVINGELLIAGGKDGIFAVNVKTLEEEELEGCPKLRYVRVIYVDSRNRIWIGHEDGLTVYDKSKFHTYSEQDGLPDNRVHSIGETESGRIFIGT